MVDARACACGLVSPSAAKYSIAAVFGGEDCKNLRVRSAPGICGMSVDVRSCWRCGEKAGNMAAKRPRTGVVGLPDNDRVRIGVSSSASVLAAASMLEIHNVSLNADCRIQALREGRNSDCRAFSTGARCCTTTSP